MVISNKKDQLLSCVCKIRVWGLDFIFLEKNPHHLATELQISFFLRTEKTRQPRCQTLPNLLLKASQLTAPRAGPHLCWYQTWHRGNTSAGLAPQMCAGRAWASSWHHTSRNSRQEPSGYLVATVGFPTSSGLCQEKCLGAGPWDILNPALLTGMGWDR